MKNTNESMGYDGVFKALGDEHRLQILELLSRKELSAGEILASMDVVQSTLSHHMKVLVDSGIVTAKRNGKWTIYSVNIKTARNAAIYLDEFLEEASHAEKAETVRRGGSAGASARAEAEKEAAKKAEAEKKEKAGKAEAEKEAAKKAEAEKRKKAAEDAAGEPSAKKKTADAAGKSAEAAARKADKKGKKSKKNGKK